MRGLAMYTQKVLLPDDVFVAVVAVESWRFDSVPISATFSAVLSHSKLTSACSLADVDLLLLLMYGLERALDALAPRLLLLLLAKLG